MKTQQEEFADEAKHALLDTLGLIPFARIDNVLGAKQPAGRIDDAVQVETPDFSRTLIIEYKLSGEPRRIRDAASQLARYSRSIPGSVPLLIAPYLSPQSAQLLTQSGISYLDLAGNCRIAFDYVFIFREGRDNPTPERRRLHTLYSPKAERVLRVFLGDPSRTWKVKTLAAEAGVSLGQVAKVKQLLEDREWIENEPTGSRLVAPRELLTEWAKNYQYRRHTEINLFCLKKISEIETSLEEICSTTGFKYALTALSAAARYAPYAPYQRVVCYMESHAAAETIIKRSGLKSVESGPNLVLLVPYDEGVFYGARDLNGARLVSPIQCYLDTLHTTSRGKEAAEHLREKVIEGK